MPSKGVTKERGKKMLGGPRAPLIPKPKANRAENFVSAAAHAAQQEPVAAQSSRGTTVQRLPLPKQL